MLHRRSITALAGLALGAALAAQDATTTPPATSPTERAPAGQAPTAPKSAADYVHDLGSDSFRLRIQAERGLRQLGQDALPELRKAADDGADAERQWRARRLVRQIERGDTGGLARRDAGDDSQPGQNGRRRSPGAAAPDDIQDRFDQLFRGLESDFGVDIPRSRFFRDDFFRDLQEQMQGLQQMPMAGGNGQSMSMQSGPDGVRVEIRSRNDKGEEESKVYEAPDLETFQQKYPGVLQQHGLGLGFGLGNGLRTLHFGNGLQGLGLPQGLAPMPLAHRGEAGDDDDEDDGQPAQAVVLPPAGKRLGVVVRPEIPKDLRDYLGLDGGLMVEQVQDGTLASSMQIKAGDIVLEIGGSKIASTKDVQDALGAIAAGAPVEVTLLRQGKALTVHADKPATHEAAPAPLAKRPGKTEGTIR